MAQTHSRGEQARDCQPYQRHHKFHGPFFNMTFLLIDNARSIKSRQCREKGNELSQ